LVHLKSFDKVLSP